MFSDNQYSRVSTNETNIINIPFCGETNTDMDLEIQSKLQKINNEKIEPDELIIGISGSRSGLSTDARRVFNDYLDKNKVIGVRSGDCIGVDAAVHKIAKERGIVSIIHPPNKKVCRAFCDGDIILRERAYLDRNHDIVNNSQLLVAFPHDKTEQQRSGTWATIRYARKQKKPIVIIHRDGTVSKETNSGKKKYSY